MEEVELIFVPRFVRRFRWIWTPCVCVCIDRTRGRPTAVNRPLNRPIPPRGSATVAIDKGPAVTLKPLVRPPLAGPYAFSRIPTPVDNNPKIYLLRSPPPTWIFSSVTAGSVRTYTHPPLLSTDSVTEPATRQLIFSYLVNRTDVYIFFTNLSPLFFFDRRP